MRVDSFCEPMFDFVVAPYPQPNPYIYRPDGLDANYFDSNGIIYKMHLDERLDGKIARLDVYMLSQSKEGIEVLHLVVPNSTVNPATVVKSINIKPPYNSNLNPDSLLHEVAGRFKHGAIRKF